MRAITVSVDYWDFLEVTLPYNRHHFDEVMVVTSCKDWLSEEVAHQYACQVFKTDSFYDNGADFNKWKALEQGLDAFGRHGWLVLIDPDVVWPKRLPEFNREKGFLYTPLRRNLYNLHDPIPEEKDWNQYQLHGNRGEWAGYSQIFHAEDEHLGQPPWHEINWRHAGGADSFFQRKWPKDKKIRPPFEILHLGMPGRNWAGRSTPYLDGTIPKKSSERAKRLKELKGQRKRGVKDPYEAEKL